MALPSTAVEWLAVFNPALYALGDSTYSTWLYLASSQMASQTTWGAIYEQAQARLASHMWIRSTVAAPATGGAVDVAPTGPLLSEQARDVKRSYGSGVPTNIKMSAGDYALSTTVDGQEYLRLRKSVPAFGMRIIRS